MTEELHPPIVFFQLKAYSLERTTVVREGMSVCENHQIGITLQSDGARIAECMTTTYSGEGCEFRQVYSSLPFIILTSHDQFTCIILLLKLQCIDTKSNGSQFRQVYSSFHSIIVTLQLQ